MSKKNEKQLYDIERLKKKDICLIFGVTEKTVYTWVQIGCPRNEDDSFMLKDVVAWQIKRIEEAKEMLRNEDGNEKNILEIMYDCGFYSKSVFNTAFKKFTGTTPSEYKKSHLGSSHR